MNKKRRTGSNPLDNFLPQIQDTREEKDQTKKDSTSKITSTSKSDVKSKSAGTSKSADTVTSNGESTITITRKSKSNEYVKMTHYFRPDQLKALDRLHKKSGRDKSELVRLAVDILVEQAKVE